MITSIADLEFNELDKKDPEIWDKIDLKLKEKLNVGLSDMKSAIASYVESHAEEIALQLPNIAPNGDYSKLIEDNDDMANFLKKEVIKPEGWILILASDHDQHKNLLAFEFISKAVDEGETLKGLVFVSKSGVIRHAFVSVNE